jgi:hypothetical protein
MTGTPSDAAPARRFLDWLATDGRRTLVADHHDTANVG